MNTDVSTGDVPSAGAGLGDPTVAATLDEWRRTDDAIGAFATIAAQRVRIIELESEVDRLLERWRGTERDLAEARAELDRRRAADDADHPGGVARAVGGVRARLEGRGR